MRNVEALVRIQGHRDCIEAPSPGISALLTDMEMFGAIAFVKGSMTRPAERDSVSGACVLRSVFSVARIVAVTAHLPAISESF